MIREATAVRRPLPVCLQDRSHDPADLETLLAMTRAERVEAMWAEQLTLSQLNEWTRRFPQEVPNLGKEIAWLTMQTEEWLDMSFEEKNNVVELHTPRRIDRAAA